MRQNTSFVDNPEFWHSSFVPALHELGYTTGLFGKVLNDMVSYGCDNISGLPPGVDRQFMMCTHTFFVSMQGLIFTLPLFLHCLHQSAWMPVGCQIQWCCPEHQDASILYRTARGQMMTL